MQTPEIEKPPTTQSGFQILFDKNGPRNIKDIKKSVIGFADSYNETVLEVINNSETGINEKIFNKNVAILMPSFKMTRQGPFKEVKYSHGKVEDPNRIIAKCWAAVGKDIVELRKLLDNENKSIRARTLVDLSCSAQKDAASRLWTIFKKLEPLCRGKTTLGLVAASKVLFAVLPEVALPIDNTQWVKVFKTLDYGDIILQMANEIQDWEKKIGTKLDRCSPRNNFTLPSIYNVMAMEARDRRINTKRA